MSPGSLFRALAAVTLVAVAAGCAPITRRPGVDDAARAAEQRKETDLAIADRGAQLRRLHRVAYRLLQAGADICAKKRATALDVGILPLNKDHFSTALRASVRRALGLTGRLQAFSVAPVSPAYAAGMRDGDILVTLDGWTVPRGSTASQDFFDKMQEEVKKKSALTFVAERAGARHTFVVTPVAVCKYGIAIDPSEQLNAHADGKRIVLNAGVMDFARTDDELAVIAGHEIAHNVMQHIQKQEDNAAIGTFFDVLVSGLTGVNTNGAFGQMGGRAYSQGFEAEADYVGLYLTARAGYDITVAPTLWRRLAIKNPANIEKNAGSSHPSSPERYVALEGTIEEIDAKRAAGEPLLPNLKDAGSTTAAQPTTAKPREKR